MSEKEKPVITKDRWTIYCLMALDHIPEKIVTEESRDGYPVKVYHFNSDAQKHYDDWTLGSNEGDMGVIRKIKHVDTLFKDNLHR